ncbi:tyrosine-type recombinase/integrase [Peribacillus simplex]|uniref:tyrosine-type recombinase/integrase n=1 Tax=Peribacillus simplex TaxID=1478 RepID=UPI0025A27A61|nr:tyrosine-type recombinase/integrase [Peribacillus simplex]MDM5291715.1 tyrosine-type recombinase/integrase [Peribacillus simplex]
MTSKRKGKLSLDQMALISPSTKDVTMEASLGEFLSHCQRLGLTKNTVINYKRECSKLIHHLKLNAGEEALEVSLELLHEGLVTKPIERGLKNSSINVLIRANKVWFTWMKKKGYIATNLMESVSLLKQRKTTIQTLTKEHIKALLKSIDTSTYAGYRDYVMYNLMLSTSLRIGEVVELEVQDIYFNKRSLIVRKGKSWNDRSVPLTRDVEHLLKNWLAIRGESDNNLLFISVNGLKLNAKTCYQILKNQGEKAGT